MNQLFFNTYDQEEEYIENAIALCDNIKYKISKYMHDNNITILTSHEEIKIVNRYITKRQIENIKKGLYTCRCCKRHKKNCPGDYGRNNLQIQNYIRYDTPNCKCKCRQYLRWLYDMENPFEKINSYDNLDITMKPYSFLDNEEMLDAFNNIYDAAFISDTDMEKSVIYENIDKTPN